MIDFNGNDKRLEAIEEIKSLKLPVFIFGGGEMGKALTDYLRENGVYDKITYVVDDEFLKPEDDFMPFSEYMTKYADKSVLIFGFYNYKIFLQKKEQYGDRLKHLYDFHLTILGNRRLRWDREEAKQRKSDYEKTYAMLSDEKSRKTMELYFRAAVNGEFHELYTECYEDTAYFNDVTVSTETDVLVDCGAYDGDSIHDFIKVFPNYKRIYALEPDPLNREKLGNRIANESIQDVFVVSKGAYKESTTLYFQSDGTSASHMDEAGDISVPVIALDELLRDCDDNIFIKMDIEGCEMDALAGAAHTIATKNPCLAICVYHKETDLVKIPQFIDSLAGHDTYDYYVRFHGLDLAELVFYAVPRK